MPSFTPTAEKLPLFHSNTEFIILQRPTDFTPVIFSQVIKANVLEEAEVPVLADPVTHVRPFAHS